jgi:hypothetical protein
MRRFVSYGKWALVPGPATMTHPLDSQSVQDLALYQAVDIAESLLSFSGMTLSHGPEPTWWGWRANWGSGQDFIEVDMTLLEEREPIVWGGSSLLADCAVETVELLWSHLQARHAGIWLHDENCVMHTHESFRAAMGGCN